MSGNYQGEAAPRQPYNSTMSTPSGPEPLPPEAQFCLALGRCLQGLGTPAHRFEATMRRTCRRFGIDAQLFALPTGYLASLAGRGFARSVVERAPNGDVNLDKLTQLHWITEGVVEGRFGAKEGTEALRLLMGQKPRYGRRMQLLAYSVTSAMAARFFGGGLKAVLLALGLGFLVGAFALYSARRPALNQAFPLLASAMVSLVAASVIRMLPFFQQLPALGMSLAGLIVLLPGLSLLIGMNELATQNLVAGTARLAGVGMVFLQLGFGLVLGQRIAGGHLGLSAFPEPGLPLWTLFPALAVWAWSFMVIYQARPDDYGWILAACGLSFGAARLGAWLYGPEFGAGLGAFLMGAGSTLAARFRNRPPWVTLIPGIILLLPGSFGLRSLEEVLKNEVLAGLSTAVQMITLSISMLGGLLLANLMAKRSDPL